LLKSEIVLLNFVPVPRIFQKESKIRKEIEQGTRDESAAKAHSPAIEGVNVPEAIQLALGQS